MDEQTLREKASQFLKENDVEIGEDEQGLPITISDVEMDGMIIELIVKFIKEEWKQK